MLRSCSYNTLNVPPARFGRSGSVELDDYSGGHVDRREWTDAGGGRRWYDIAAGSVEGGRSLACEPVIKGRCPTHKPKTAMIKSNPVLNLGDSPSAVETWSPHPEAGMSRKKIMIVEDETITLALTRKFLLDAGYEVVATQDGGAAVSLAMAESPDLVLLDLGLPAADPFSGPHFDGFTIIDWFHRMLKELKTPIIVVTAQTGPEVRQRVLEAGAVAYFSKPVDKEKLLREIRIALE